MDRVVVERVVVDLVVDGLVFAGGSTLFQFPFSFFCQLPSSRRYTFPSRPA
jgi:hypothetical protein